MSKLMMVDIMAIKEYQVEESLIYHQKQNKRCFIFSSELDWSNKTRVNIYYGLWKRKMISFPKQLLLKNRDDYVENSEGKIQFYGLAEINPAYESYAINKMAGYDTFLFYSERDFDVLFEASQKLFEDNYQEFYAARRKIEIDDNIMTRNVFLGLLKVDEFCVYKYFYQDLDDTGVDDSKLFILEPLDP